MSNAKGVVGKESDSSETIDVNEGEKGLFE